MAEQYAPNLGGIPGPDARRDAVHVAVAPAVAAEYLKPGDHVILNEAGQAEVTLSTDPHAVGVVDPFLKRPLNAGERFWLLLRPGSITGLRHVWTHPAFRPKAPGKEAP